MDKSKVNIQINTYQDFLDWKISIMNSEILQDELVSASVAYCVGNGLMDEVESDNENKLFDHLPFSLVPATIDKETYLELCDVSIILHKLINTMSRDFEFIISKLQICAEGDPMYLGKYLEIYKKQHELGEFNQKYQMGILRTDYIQNKLDDKWGQLEVNISGVGGVSEAEKFSQFRKSMIERYGNLIFETQQLSSGAHPKGQNIYYPFENSLECITRAIATAARLVHPENPKVLILNHETENSIIDQRSIEMELFKKYKIPCIRRTLIELYHTSIFDNKTKEFIIDDNEYISCIYFHNNRLGYKSSEIENFGEEEWEVLERIEFSKTIKENLGVTLMGTKYIQALFSSDPTILSRYLIPIEIELLHKYCFNLYPLDKYSDNIIEDAIQHNSKYVLKPQREGGSHNFFDYEIEEELTKENNDPCAYILMERIYGKEFKAMLVNKSKYEYVENSVVEIGIFSCFLSCCETDIINEICGSYSKTRKATVNEGGICHGQGVIDSFLLID